MGKTYCATCKTKLSRKRSCQLLGYDRGYPVLSNDCPRCGVECCMSCVDAQRMFGILCSVSGCRAVGCNFCMHNDGTPEDFNGFCDEHKPPRRSERLKARREACASEGAI